LGQWRLQMQDSGGRIPQRDSGDKPTLRLMTTAA
jgi:hypothetical protein